MQKLLPQPLPTLLPMQLMLLVTQLMPPVTPSTQLAKMLAMLLVTQLMPLEKPSTKLVRKLKK